jgi:hypothetical protein
MYWRILFPGFTASCTPKCSPLQHIVCSLCQKIRLSRVIFHRIRARAHAPDTAQRAAYSLLLTAHRRESLTYPELLYPARTHSLLRVFPRSCPCCTGLSEPSSPLPSERDVYEKRPGSAPGQRPASVTPGRSVRWNAPQVWDDLATIPQP